ncbi:MAG: radical SAM protein [Nitrososphaerota archaeon]|nr:radical SAM protein [Nitrososphaerota archaeon]
MKHCDKEAITVNPTNKCNLRCIYCMASSTIEQEKPISIDTEFAKCGIFDALNGHPTGKKAKILRFFSPGEPTQNIDCMKECVNYAKELKPDIIVELQTNGVYDNNSVRDWIAENVNIVWVSLDGPSDINGKYRPDRERRDRTAEIEENIRIMQTKTSVGVRATIVNETTDSQDKLVKYFHSLGIKYITVDPMIESIRREDKGFSGAITKINLMRFAEGFLKGYKTATKIGVSYGCSLTFNFDQRTNIACRSCLPMPQLNPDGSISSCDMALYSNTPPELQCFLYGYWDSKNKQIVYDQNKIKNLQNRTVSQLNKCHDCEIKYNCAGGCAGRVAFEKGGIYDTIPEYCSAIKYLSHRMQMNANIIPSLYTHP